MRYESSSQAAANSIVRRYCQQAISVVTLSVSGDNKIASKAYLDLITAIASTIIERFQPVFSKVDLEKAKQRGWYIFHPSICAAEALCKMACKAQNKSTSWSAYEPPLQKDQLEADDRLYGEEYSKTSSIGGMLAELGDKRLRQNAVAKAFR